MVYKGTVLNTVMYNEGIDGILILYRFLPVENGAWESKFNTGMKKATFQQPPRIGLIAERKCV